LPSQTLRARTGLYAVSADSSTARRVSFDATRSEVQVRSEWGSRSVVEVIDAVQWWLAAYGIRSAGWQPLVHNGGPELRSIKRTGRVTALTSQLPLTTVHEEQCGRIAAAALAWEDEVGHRSADDEPDVETDRGEHASIGLSWSELLRRFFFPGRRRHDLEAHQSYAAYRSEIPRAASRAISLPVAVSKESRKEARA
jgi:hypothetical protein